MWLDLRISPEERELLLDILTIYQGTLRTETHRTGCPPTTGAQKSRKNCWAVCWESSMAQALRSRCTRRQVSNEWDNGLRSRKGDTMPYHLRHVDDEEDEELEEPETEEEEEEEDEYEDEPSRRIL